MFFFCALGIIVLGPVLNLNSLGYRLFGTVRMNKGGVGLGGAASGGGGPTAGAAAAAAQKQKALLQRVDADVGNLVDNFGFLVNVARVCSQSFLLNHVRVCATGIAFLTITIFFIFFVILLI